MNTDEQSRLWNHAAIKVMDIRQRTLQPSEEWRSYRLPANCFLYSFRGSAQIRLDGSEHAAPREPLKLYQLAAKLNSEWQLGGSLERLHVKSVFYQFVHEMLAQLRMQESAADQPTVARQVIRYIYEHFAETITMESLAQHFSYSVRYLTRLFKQETGYSPIDYLIQVRIGQAKNLLLHTDATIQEIAASVGYADHHYFNRLFKKHTGVPPGNFHAVAQGQQAAFSVPDRPSFWPELSIAPRRTQRYSVTDNDYQQAFGGTIRMNRRSRHSFAFLLFCSLTLLLSACATNTTPPAENAAAGNGSVATTPAAAERVLKDALGHEVKVPANPQRIIASYLEDHLIALGVKPVAQWSVKGGEVQNYLQDSLKGIPPIPYDLPFEAVMSFQPDLIIVDSADTVAGDKYAQYAKIAPTYTVGTEKNNDWRQELLIVGDVLNKREQAQKVLDAYEQKARDAKEKLQKTVGAKTAAVLWVTQKGVFVVSEHLSSGDVLYKDLGFQVPDVVKEISKTGTANWNAISLEKISSLNADYLFLVNSEGEKEKISKDPVWANIPAVKNKHVYEFGKETSWLYTGTIANTQIIDDVLKSVVGAQ